MPIKVFYYKDTHMLLQIRALMTFESHNIVVNRIRKAVIILDTEIIPEKTLKELEELCKEENKS